jgi:hypothetical protein
MESHTATPPHLLQAQSRPGSLSSPAVKQSTHDTEFRHGTTEMSLSADQDAFVLTGLRPYSDTSALSAQIIHGASSRRHFLSGRTAHPVTPSIGSEMVPQALPLHTMGSSGGQQHFQAYVPDTSGQVAPPGMKPRVTATLWEDEGSLCFQVEARGVCVARREDNHMINGTKLLNVANMTRRFRDSILKSEKTRHVVKIGPLHLKGVW